MLRQCGRTAMLCLRHLVVRQVADVSGRDPAPGQASLDLFREPEGSVRPPPMSGRGTAVPATWPGGLGTRHLIHLLSYLLFNTLIVVLKIDAIRVAAAARTGAPAQR